jgi:hypothetical protein
MKTSREVKADAAAIFEIGCDGSSYLPGAVRVVEEKDGSSLVLDSLVFAPLEPCPNVEPLDFPITRQLARAAGAAA